jgi:hypothetical protein
MSIIKQPLLFAGSLGEKHLQVLYDSGKEYSCINPKFLDNVETPVQLEKSFMIRTMFESRLFEVRQVVQLDFYMGDVLLSDEFLVIPGLSEEAIIGAATMQKWRIKLDFEHDTAIVDPKVAKMQLV